MKFNRNIPYADAPILLDKDAPRILYYFQSPHGLLAVNLARCAYTEALAAGLTTQAALECADAELDAIGLGGRIDVGDWVANAAAKPFRLIALPPVVPDIYAEVAKHILAQVAS